MSHNGLIDIWRLGGVVYILSFLLLIFSIARELNNHNSQDDIYFYARGFFGLFFANFIFYTGIFVNPSLSILFWINLAYLLGRRDG